MSTDVFLLDTNVFVEAHRRYYGLDLCPGFWECLTHFNGMARVVSLDRVRDEIHEGDALAEWIKGAPVDLFASSADEAVVDKYAEMITWVNGADFTDAAKADFASAADGWLAAYAKVRSMVLVTHEEYTPGAKKVVKLPNVCREFDVRYADTFDMLREFEVKFNWALSS